MKAKLKIPAAEFRPFIIEVEIQYQKEMVEMLNLLGGVNVGYELFEVLSKVADSQSVDRAEHRYYRWNSK